MISANDIRRLYDMKEILGMSRGKNQIVCPLPQHHHHSHTPSFSVYWNRTKNVQLFKCHGSCGLEGDVIDLMGYMKIPGYKPGETEDTKRAIALLRGTGVISVPQKPRQQSLLTNDVAARYAPARQEVVEYARTRGLSKETLDRFQIGQFNAGSTAWMTIPTFTGQRLTMLKMRNIDSRNKKDRYRNMPGSTAGMFNAGAVKKAGADGKVLIVKAEIVTMLLHQHGFLSCAPNAGEGNVNPEWYKDVMFCQKRVVVGDNDPDPKVREDMMAFTRERANIFRAEMRVPPEKYKDLDEFILAEPETALPMIRGWLE